MSARLGCGAGEEDDEFVTAPAAGKVGRTDHVFQDTCDSQITSSPLA